MLDMGFVGLTDKDIEDLPPMFHNLNCDYKHTEIFDKDCVYCMWLWNEFLEKNNIYVSTDKGG